MAMLSTSTIRWACISIMSRDWKQLAFLIAFFQGLIKIIQGNFCKVFVYVAWCLLNLLLDTHSEFLCVPIYKLSPLCLTLASCHPKNTKFITPDLTFSGGRLGASVSTKCDPNKDQYKQAGRRLVRSLVTIGDTMHYNASVKPKRAAI